ncbi:MAG: proline dehydrogenase family protein [Acidobacteriota bacterium]
MSLFDKLVVTTLPLVPKFIVGKVASRYVAGSTLQDAIRTIQTLNAEGACCTVDLLGEEITEMSKAEEAVVAYEDVLDAIVEHRLDCNISVKPTQLGLGLDDDQCRANYERLVSKAKAQDCFVRLDMEDRHTTDATIALFRHLHSTYGNAGPVFQAYMRRTLNDIAELPAEGVNVRLCKGIYIEPREAAWKGFDTVRRNFVTALEKLFRQGVYVGIATHDEYLCCAAVELIDRLQVPKDRYEFQMLLGVENQLRKILIAEGHKLRVYVPYGRDWYLYSMRRLRENPQVAGHVMRAILRGD